MAYQRRYNPYTANQPAQQAQRKPKNRTMANKGKSFEITIEGACKQYRTLQLADIEKIPAPVQITGRNGQNVTGRLERARFTDFEGILKDGRGIVLEAKECNQSTAFPLANIGEHQYAKLKKFHQMNGVAFLLVYRVHYKKYYRVPFEVLQDIWEATKHGGQKSIPQQIFETRCVEVQGDPKLKGIFHFLKGVI